jgi:hypothetical protein
MDQKLLNALNNIGIALEELVDALNSKSEAKTATSSAIQSGDFSKDLKSISEGIKSIKADTQTIIKNQQTIIAQGKERESAKTKDIETDPKKESAIKKGVGTILLIAVAVLAIGMAFKLVGDVDVLSVIGLALGITLIAIAFEKVAELKIDLKKAFITSTIMVMMSAALTVSSWILSNISPLTTEQGLTAVLITSMFYFILPATASIIKAMEGEQEVEFRGIKIKTKGINLMTALSSVIALPLIMIGVSAGITASSWILSKVKVISIEQGMTAVAIGFVFSLLAPTISAILTGITSDGETSIAGIGKIKKKGVDIKSAAIASFFIPIIMTGVSIAILASSYILSQIKKVEVEKLLTAVAISALFAVLAYGISKIMSGLDGINKGLAILAAFIIPLLFIATSYAVAKSSEYLSGVMPMKSFSQFITAIGISVLFVVMAFAISLVMKSLSDMDKSKAITASIIMPILFIAMSYAITMSSNILKDFKEIDYSTLFNIVLFSIAISVSTIALGATVWALNKLGLMSPQGLLMMVIGGISMLVVAGTIAASSHILALGNYKNYPSLDWAKGVSLSLGAFALGMTTLGAIIFATFGAGALMLAAGSLAVLGVAKTIVAASDILANGYTDEDGKVMKPNYKGGPTKEWAEGIAIALGAFSPVYGMLMKNKLLSFLGGGVGPEDFSKAIKTVSQGIVSAANFFASSENPGVWAGHPTKEWAEGIGTAIGAFAPVYEILTGQSWLSKKINPEDFAGEFDDSGKLIKPGAIQVIARGIISAAQFFANNTAPFEEGSYPSKNWGEGVGAALGAFSPVFEALQNKGWFKSDKKVVDGMINGIISITNAIVKTATIFSKASKNAIFDVYPDINWSNNVRTTIEKFVDLSNYLEKNKKTSYWIANSVANRIVSMAKILHSGSEFFSNSIDPNYISSVSKNMLDFNELIKQLTDSESEGMLSKLGNNLLGTDPIMQIAKRMITLAEGYDKLAESLIKLGGAMKVLNISDIRMLGGLTSTIQSGESSKGGALDSVKESLGFKKADTSQIVQTGGGGMFGGEKRSFSEDIEKIIKLLSNIDKSTEESSVSLTDMLSQLKDDGIKINKASI